MDNVFLPRYDEIRRKQENGFELDPLEKFIYENEPAGEKAEKEFRQELKKLVEFLIR